MVICFSLLVHYLWTIFIRHKSGVVSDVDDAYLYFVFSGKAVSEKVPALFDIIEDLLVDSRLDNQQRAVEILKEWKSSRENSVQFLPCSQCFESNL